MAKGARASTIKANNSKLKSRVFGPIETARTERLSAKLLELAAQPKPQSKDADIMMDTESGSAEAAAGSKSDGKQTDDMDIDGAPKTTAPSKRSLRVEKRRSSSRKASIVFPKFKAGKRVGVKSKRS